MKKTCKACKGRGHNIRTCPNKRHCRRCGRAGHTARKCPNAWWEWLHRRPS